MGRSHGSNYMTRVYGTKRDDFANGRAGLTEHVAKRSKGLILIGATVHMDRGMHGGVECDVC